MITGTICLVVGVIGLVVSLILLFRVNPLVLPVAFFAMIALTIGMATYTCDPASPWFGWPGSCVGGVPWP